MLTNPRTPTTAAIPSTQTGQASHLLLCLAVPGHKLSEARSHTSVPCDGISSPSVSMTMTGSLVPVDNAFNHAWRETVLRFTHTRSWKDDVLQSVMDSAYHNATYIAGQKLRQLAPNTFTGQTTRDPPRSNRSTTPTSSCGAHTAPKGKTGFSRTTVDFVWLRSRGYILDSDTYQSLPGSPACPAVSSKLSA